jgi:pyrroline-5-carboxylate reductase
MPYELAIIGAGVMAEAIARGILRGGVLPAEQMIAADISAPRREFFQNTLGIKAVEDAAVAAADAAAVLLCVKPHQMQGVLQRLGAAMHQQPLVISIAAGIGTTFIEKTLGGGKRWRIVRAVPNTPMLVGEGMVAIAAGAHASPADLSRARQIFQAGANVLQTTEDKLDAVTAVSGSGPAYFFFLVEQMIRAATELGLGADEARTLAIQTAAGAAKIMSQPTDAPADPAEHRRRVTTPGGTTHAAINHLEAQHWPQITVDAIKAAAQRSREMGK